MTATSTPPLHVLRGILRLAKSAPPKPSATASATAESASASSLPPNDDLPFQRRVISQYRQNISLSPHEARVQRQIAYDYWILKQDLAERARLHELDQGADEKLSPKELSRRAAARAGLQLPKLDADEGER
ncbi:hypothetical protein ACHAXT_004370 [Thalassiosira profunda]